MDIVQEMFGDIKREGSDPFPELEKETPSDSLPEKEPEEVKPPEGVNTPEENIPFHKDPRWIKREEELQELRQFKDEVAPKLTEIESRLPGQSSIPDWFKELYGENQFAWEKYSEHDKTQRAEIKREILEEQELARRQQAEESTRWNKWVDDEIQKLQDDGAVFDRNKLIKTMLDYRPTDDQNNFDFKKGYEIYKKDEALSGSKQPAKSNARKQLADTASGSSQGEKVVKNYQTRSSLPSWDRLLEP